MNVLSAVLLGLGVLCPGAAVAGAFAQLQAAAGSESAPVVAPAPGVRFTHARVLKVLSYNIKGNPAAFLEGFKGERYAEIGKSLARLRERGEQPDVVLLQESFTLRARQVRKKAGYPYYARGPREDHTLLSAGLYILSEHPITQTRMMAFGSDICTSYDCFANKGALGARIQVPGVPFEIDIYTTHLQSGGKEKADALRVTQMNGLLEGFLPGGPSPEIPFIFSGDFNSNPTRASYDLFVARTGLSNAGADCRGDVASCRIEADTDPATLLENTQDQHFYYPGGTGRYQLRPIYARRPYPLSEKLSDHLAYEVHYELRW